MLTTLYSRIIKKGLFVQGFSLIQEKKSEKYDVYKSYDNISLIFSSSVTLDKLIAVSINAKCEYA